MTDNLIPGQLVLEPRDVHFDWTGLPPRWIPGQPHASHILNVLHMLLPELERWLVKTFKQALPYITDERLREDVTGFIAQEAIHAEAHQSVLDYLNSHGLDTAPYIRHAEWIFRHVLGEAETRGELAEHVATAAAIEHLTSFVGHWILNSPELDAARAHPVMLDLLRWHGAEEVEHRSVAFELMRHLDPSYTRRIRAFLVAAPLVIWLWVRGARFLLRADNERLTLGAYLDSLRRGLLPSPGAELRSAIRYFRPGYHPIQEASTRQAVAYLGTSPAARAAAR
ncbi:MAG: metal-dependent hydrolase [Streptosporangiaceae bacterium]|jgi:predicted metal-dependent hydrolase